MIEVLQSSLVIDDTEYLVNNRLTELTEMVSDLPWVFPKEEVLTAAIDMMGNTSTSVGTRYLVVEFLLSIAEKSHFSKIIKKSQFIAQKLVEVLISVKENFCDIDDVENSTRGTDLIIRLTKVIGTKALVPPALEVFQIFIDTSDGRRQFATLSTVLHILEAANDDNNDKLMDTAANTLNKLLVSYDSLDIKAKGLGRRLIDTLSRFYGVAPRANNDFMQKERGDLPRTPNHSSCSNLTYLQEMVAKLTTGSDRFPDEKPALACQAKTKLPQVEGGLTIERSHQDTAGYMEVDYLCMELAQALAQAREFLRSHEDEYRARQDLERVLEESRCQERDLQKKITKLEQDNAFLRGQLLILQRFMPAAGHLSIHPPPTSASATEAAEDHTLMVAESEVRPEEISSLE